MFLDLENICASQQKCKCAAEYLITNKEQTTNNKRFLSKIRLNCSKVQVKSVLNLRTAMKYLFGTHSSTYLRKLGVLK